MLNKNYYHDVPKVVQEYLNYQSTIKNKSDNTINEYCLDLRLFLKFLYCDRHRLNAADPDVLESVEITGLDRSFFQTVTLQDAYAFLSYCRSDRQNLERARARKVSCIRAFFKYLKMQNVIPDNPMVNLDSPKLKKSQPKYLTIEQAQKLLMSVDGPNKERDYCILTFFLNCGLRLSELVSMDYNKIRLTADTATMVITGKGNKERTVYLNHACVAALNAYMRVRPKDGVKDRYALFLSDRKQRISRESVQHLVKKYLDKAELGGLGYSVHKLRHTAATLMYQTGKVDLLELKEILGHENLNTTQIYTHIVDQRLKDAVDSNPLADFTQKK